MRLVIDLQGAQSASRHRGIGRYSLALADAMVRKARHHEVWIALNGALPQAVESLRTTFCNILPPERIVTWEVPTPVTGLDTANEWRRTTGELLREGFLASLKPDMIHISSLFEGFGDDAVVSTGRLTDGRTTATTLYDFIPLNYPEQFLSTPVQKNWYHEKLQSLRQCGLWLAISEASRQEGTKWLGLPSDRIVNISAAAHSRFRRLNLSEEAVQDTRQRYGLTRPFVLYTGSIDPHKNLPGLLQAYSKLDLSVRRAHQLLIVCPAQEVDIKPLTQLAHHLGLAADELVFARFVPDDDLVALYNLCKVFCLPSTNEGFGLPALEAMQCGAATIGSNRYSIPEVIGRADALFNPSDADDIAARLQQTLSDESYRQSLVEHGLQQARKFTWEESARRAWDAFEDYHDRTRSETGTINWSTAQHETPAPQARLAYVVTSVPEEPEHLRTDILSGLARYYEIDLIVPKPGLGNQSEMFHAVSDYEFFDQNAAHYDRVLYSPSNAGMTSQIIELMKRHPGVIILDNIFLGTMISDCEDASVREFFVEELYRSHGYHAVKKLAEAGSIAAIAEQFPASLSILQHSLGIIFTAEDVRQLAGSLFGDQFASEWIVVGTKSEDSCRPPASSDALSLRYYNAIESFWGSGYEAAKMRLLRATAATDTGSQSEREWLKFARTINRNMPVLQAEHQLLVDISELVQRDARTGIQRVTRSILMELLTRPPKGFRVEPVYATSDAPGYRYARNFAFKFLNCTGVVMDDAPVEVQRGDIFLGLDLQHFVVLNQEQFFKNLRMLGVEIHFVVYDLLPILLPQYFPDGSSDLHARWLTALGQRADGLICISRSVADELMEWLAMSGVRPARPLRVDWFHLGSDIEMSAPTTGLPDRADEVIASIAARPTFLTVGTVEPRKGHAQVLAAFEQFWATGGDANLVIIGKQGWKVELLVEKLRRHPELNKRLFWLEGISDEYLEKVYAASVCLIAASEGEGFGLPLIEAARHRMPILARDLPVFREVAGSAAYYFSGGKPSDLADAIKNWLMLYTEDRHPRSDELSRLTWAESAESLKAVLMKEASYKLWDAGTATTLLQLDLHEPS